MNERMSVNTFHSMHEYRGSERIECEDRSTAGNEMCYLGEMLEGGWEGGWGCYGLVFLPISALRSNFSTGL